MVILSKTENDFPRKENKDRSSRRHITESAWSWPEIPPPVTHPMVARRHQGSL